MAIRRQINEYMTTSGINPGSMSAWRFITRRADVKVRPLSHRITPSRSGSFG